MSKDQSRDIKKSLIDELESLHSSLSSAAGNAGDANTDDATTDNGSDENGIPILVDIISSVSAEVAADEIKQENSAKAEGSEAISAIYRQTLVPQKQQGGRRFDMSMIPTLYPEQPQLPEQDDRFDDLVDELVAEYLPILEHRLRTKLRQRFNPHNKTH